MAYTPITAGGGELLRRQIIQALDQLGANMGDRIESNSTTVALGAGETFTGEWVENDSPQVGFNLLSDQDGFLYLEMSADGGTTITATIPYEVSAGEPRFDALVKLPGRAFRLRYINGATPQGAFVLLAATGDGLYPYKPNDRDLPRFVAYSGSAISADTYAILVDLSDKANFPHSDTGSIDLYSSFLFVDKPANAVGAVQLGVITRIDGTDSDIAYIQGASFNGTSDRQLSRDRVLTHPIQLRQTGGSLDRVATLFRATGITAVNTGVTLPTAFGTATPAVGDLIILFAYTSGGTYDAAVSAQYAGNVNS